MLGVQVQNHKFSLKDQKHQLQSQEVYYLCSKGVRFIGAGVLGIRPEETPLQGPEESVSRHGVLLEGPEI